MHVTLDTDNQERYAVLAQKMGVSVNWLANWMLRNIKTIEQQVTLEMKETHVRSPKSSMQLPPRTAWKDRY